MRDHRILIGVVVLVTRDSAKLRKLLAERDGVDSTAMDRYLTIYEGDAKDRACVAKTVMSPVDKDALVDVIVTGIGAYPTFQWSIRQPFPLTDPTICETFTRTLYSVLGERLQANSTRSKDARPLLVAVSTAGCGRNRGVPLSLYLPYHYFLSSPLADKVQMEKLLLGDKGSHIRDFVIMRPLFLTDGEPRSKRDPGAAGWEWGVEPVSGVRERELGPRASVTVSRKEVGQWIFENAIVQGGWEGKCVYL